MQCLNTLITQGLIKPQLYDIIDEVFSTMIKSYEHTIRDLCKTVLFNYIQNAPLSDSLVEKFILKLVNNINFEER